jgi:5-methylcytosine-specific restriction endonuclease McrA
LLPVEPVVPVEPINEEPVVNDVCIVDKDVCREMKRQIQNKISSYKMQDIQKKKYDDDKFVDFQFVISLLVDKKLSCFYCKESVYLFYNYVRENKQWTLERIYNERGHNTDNVEIACLNCNLRRRTMYHERYLFTKQLSVVKLPGM